MKGQKEARVSGSLSLEKEEIQGWLKRLPNQVGRARVAVG